MFHYFVLTKAIEFKATDKFYKLTNIIEFEETSFPLKILNAGNIKFSIQFQTREKNQDTPIHSNF